MSTEWPEQAKPPHADGHSVPVMHAAYVNGITIRPLRNGDVATVLAVFGRLGEQARASRFCGAKPRLNEAELALLARVDSERHVLVGYVDGDPRPAGIARLARDGGSAEIALSVADELRGRGVGTALLSALAADARAAGITSFVATICGDNPSMVRILHRLSSSLEVRWRRGEREIVVPLGA
jgi:GNAT superfamily N-acetyltransferase